MWKRLFLLILLGTGLVFQGRAQLNTKRCKWIKAGSEPFQLDSLTLLPSSVQFYRPDSEPLHFQYNASTNQFQLEGATKGDSVLVCYRVLPLNLGQIRKRRDAAGLDSATFEENYVKEDFSVREEIFSTPGLNKTGSISRGISFGNTQNVFVNSALNLQLEGKLSEEIKISGTISDQNIPIQPEGNTQQLQEFDRVYLTLQHRLWTVTAGDIVLRNKPGYFTRFYKNVQGGSAEVNLGSRPERSSSTMAALALAKGKFASTALEPLEGVQGPYRLRGPAGERFIVVLAGSERVYLDGRLLVRGFDFDYVIDYNLAEITFTPRNLILRNSRIRVDFEYSVQNYTRSIQHLSHYQTFDNLKVHFNYYKEADNPNQPVNADLDASQIKLLQSVGDSLNLAVVPGADSVGFVRNQIRYRQIDSLWAVTGAIYRIYVQSTDSTKAIFDVRFSDVGQGRGDYQQKTTTVNGRVFEWVGPGRGRYAPVRTLPAATLKQIASLGASYQVDEYTALVVETASSKNDLNRFSILDAADDAGNAMKVGYTVQGRPLSMIPGYKLQSNLNYEYNSRNFTPIDRFRDIEFDRDWSLPAGSRPQSDNIFSFSLGAAKDLNNLVNYRVSRRFRQGEVSGLQHWLDAARQIGALEWKGSFFVLRSDRPLAHSRWERGDATLRYNGKWLVPGYTYRFDKNKVQDANQTGRLVSSAIYFEEHTAFVQSPDSAKTRYRMEHRVRQDRFLRTGEQQLGERQKSQTSTASLTTAFLEDQQIDALVTYRERVTVDSLPERTLMSKIDYSGSLLDKHLRQEVSYSIATGRELKRDYTYVPAISGGATHYWTDLNHDGEQTKEEFYQTQPGTVYSQDSLFIKQFIPTDEYIKAYTNRFTYRLTTSMPRKWNGLKGMKGFMGRFSSLHFLSIDKRTTDPSISSRLDPFSNRTEESDLLSLSKSFRNTLYFNRSHPRYGLELNWQNNEQKQLLVNGTESRTLEEQNLNLRLNWSQEFSSRVVVTGRSSGNRSNYLTGRNFLIKGTEITPDLSWQPTQSFRLTGTYRYSRRENQTTLETDTAKSAPFLSHEFGLESRINQVSKRTITAQARLIRISYEGAVNTVVGTELLNSLRPGNNITWNLSLQQRLSNGLNLTMNYEGRKSGFLPANHLGRMQVSVLF